MLLILEWIVMLSIFFCNNVNVVLECNIVDDNLNFNVVDIV